jgi:5'-3' exonuclease
VQVHLVDGTYELFRAFFGAPPAEVRGREVGAARGLLRSLAAWLKTGQVTHIGVAFDTVIESFRNQLFAGYKTGDGMEPALWAQFPLAEQVAAALGCAVWGMIDFEADDALATAAAIAAADPRVTRVVIASPDKDLCQCVDDRVITWDRLRDRWFDVDGVRGRLGVAPASVPDLLAVVGDDADGIPGLPRWGARSAAAVLAHYQHLEAIPKDGRWDVPVRGAAGLAATLAERWDEALLYRTLATLRRDAPIAADLDAVAWHGAHPTLLPALCDELEIPVPALPLSAR